MWCSSSVLPPEARKVSLSNVNVCLLDVFKGTTELFVPAEVMNASAMLAHCEELLW